MTIEETDKCRAVAKAALELIAKQGFHGTPISQIAKQAGVGVGSIYRYFADKDELIHAIHARVEDRLHEVLIESLGDSLPARERFLELVKLLVNYFVSNPIEFNFLEQYYNSPYGIEKMREKFLENPDDPNICLNDERDQPFFDLLATERGKLIKNLPVPMIHSLSFGPMIFLVRDILNGFIELTDELLEQFAEGCWDAIKI